jgi:transcriptional regulator
MYIPKAFEESDLEALHGLIRAHSFATLVSTGGAGLEVSHLPLLLESECGRWGTLYGHMARANAQWREFQSGAEALAIFHGPHAYISPGWYESWPAVPTWNYVVVHAYGVPRLIEEEALYSLLGRMVQTFDAAANGAGSRELPDDYMARMAKAIVGFEIEITRLEGKRKLGQNRSPADRRSAVAALKRAGNAQSVAVAELMRDLLEP